MKRYIKNKIAKVKDLNFDILSKPLTDKDKKQIDKAVRKVVQEYGETLRLLGKT